MWKNILKDDSNDKNWSKFQEVLDKYPALDIWYSRSHYGSDRGLISLDSLYITWDERQSIIWDELVTSGKLLRSSSLLSNTIRYFYVLDNKDKFPEIENYKVLPSYHALFEEALEVWSASLKALDWFITSVPKEVISSNDNIMYIEILGGTMSIPLTASCNNSYENDEGEVFNMCIRARDTEVIASPDNWLSYYLIYSQLAKLDNYHDIEDLSEQLNLPDVIHRTLSGVITIRCGACETEVDDLYRYQGEWDCERCGLKNEYENSGEIASEEGVGPYINGTVIGFECPFGHSVYNGEDATCDAHHIKAHDSMPAEGWEHIDFDFQIGDDCFYIDEDMVLNVYEVTQSTISDYLSSNSADALLGYEQDEYILTEHPDVEDIGEYNNETLWKDSNYYYYYDDDGQIQYSETNPNDEDE